MGKGELVLPGFDQAKLLRESEKALTGQLAVAANHDRRQERSPVLRFLWALPLQNGQALEMRSVKASVARQEAVSARASVSSDEEVGHDPLPGAS